MTFKGYIKGYININVKHRRSKNWDFFPPSKKFLYHLNIIIYLTVLYSTVLYVQECHSKIIALCIIRGFFVLGRNSFQR